MTKESIYTKYTTIKNKCHNLSYKIIKALKCIKRENWNVNGKIVVQLLQGIYKGSSQKSPPVKKQKQKD